MASSRVLASSASSARPDLARPSPMYAVGHMSDLSGDRRGGSLGSMNMEELLRGFYADTPAAPGAEIPPYDGDAVGEEKGGGDRGGGCGRDVAPSRQGSSSVPGGARGKTVEEVWKEISRDRKVDDGAEPACTEAGGFEGMTLEAFLARAGAVTEEDVGAPPVAVQPPGEGPVLGFVVDPAMADRYGQQQQQLLHVDGSIAGFGNGTDSGTRGRGKRRSLEDPVDKAAQQKQRRMIKNRESAARSRERKQAYILELETIVTKLEEENASLIREQEEQEKARLKQLMENLIPVVEKKRPPRCLRRTCSVQW